MRRLPALLFVLIVLFNATDAAAGGCIPGQSPFGDVKRLARAVARDIVYSATPGTREIDTASQGACGAARNAEWRWPCVA